MLKIVLGTKNEGMLQLNLAKIERGILPRPLLLISLFLFGLGLFGVVIILTIVRRDMSSAYRVSYQEFVTSPDGVTSSTLWHMYPDGSQVRQFAPLEYSVIKGGVSWSPDASEIVFMRITDHSQPAVQRTTWHDIQATSVILTTRTDIPQPQWSPDGRYFALTLRGALVIWDVQANETLHSQQPSTEAWYHSPLWFPAENAVLFVAREDDKDTLLKISIPNGAIQSITENIPTVVNHRMQTPTISPDGQWLAVHLSNADLGTARIVLINLAEQSVRNILNTPSGQFNPRWSPDGHWLVYNGGFQLGQTGGSVYRVNMVEGATQQLPQTVQSASGVVWSPDGRWLYYAAPENNTWNIYRSNHNGSQAERLTNSPNAQLFPTVSPLIDQSWHGWLLSVLGVFALVIAGYSIAHRL